MDNNSNTLLGWEAVADALSSETLNNPLVTGTFSTGNDDISDDEIKRLQRTNRGPSVKEVFGIDASKEEKDTEVEETEEETEVEEKEVEEPKKKDKQTKEVENVEETSTEEEELDNEGIQVSAFFDAITEELGLDFEEDEEVQKPKTVEELCEYFKDLIEENSTPEYSSEEVAKIMNLFVMVVN